LIPRQRAAPGRNLPPVPVRPIWIIPAVLAAALGAWDLTRPALWADELATWGAVRLSWDQLWQLSGTVDAPLTPYYVLMKVYASLAGTSTLALRLPGLIAIVGTTVVVTALGRRLGGTTTGLLAGVIFAVLPVTSRYAQEVRPYAFVMFGTALATLALVRLLERPAYGRAAGYVGALALSDLSHPLGALLVIAGHVGAILWLRRWRALIPAAAGALPAAALIALGSGERQQVAWIPKLTGTAFFAIPDRLFLSAAAGGIVLGLAVLGLRRAPAYICVALAAFVPLIALAVAGFFAPVFVARYVLVVLPPLAVLAASAAARFAGRHAVALLALIALLGGPAQLSIRTPAGHGEDSTKVATVIAPLYRPGDVAVFPDTNPSIPWAARDIYARYLPTPRPPDVLAVTPQRVDGRLLATECPADDCLGNPPRIWIIRADDAINPVLDMTPGKQRLLSEDYKTTRRWSYPLLTIMLLQRKLHS
jgi:mannosyltransferase